ncbi:MAG: type I-B CRISPR-associated protein Cas7/Csh2 [Thermodesulfobacteriota bacterium]|nr:type I-B CRISPR-associated protein Cas7/Csh2 [Thermodesulfobacteriota bacterium]
MSKIENRSEILFLYDIENANPNGDPNDENKPRIDEETGKNIVTDVRLKRTIRDYLMENGNDIFVREKIYDNEGHIQDAKLRASDYLPEDKEKLSSMTAEQQKKYISDTVLNQCIDIKLFGATIPLDLKVKKGEKTTTVTSSITYTGPVQFKMGKSLHSVKMMHIKGTGAFASKQGATQKAFREEYILPYSLIGFCGVINENAAEHTLLQTDDVKLLKEAIWKGTKGLISRSKFGQMPRLFLVINYNQPNFFIGDIDNLISLVTEKRDEQIRKPEEYSIDITMLMEKINNCDDKIESVEYITDSRMKFMCNGDVIKLEGLDKFADYSAEVS